ncbi:MAG: hypothetical protein IT303_03865 [Dehalococcoidia bacterium]|nr:hypothetical protein [Dehalococcoidia bacterium]
MSAVYGFAGLSFVSAILLPVAVLILAFVLVRWRRGDELDLAAGVTAYVSFLLATSAVVMVVGGAMFLAGVFGNADAGFTYGIDDPFSEGSDQDDIQLAQGVAWIAMGALIAAAHIVLRQRLAAAGHLDDGVEAACETLVTVLAGVLALFFVASAVGSAFERAAVDESDAAPGSALAYAIPFVLLWVVYGSRVLRRLGLSLSGTAVDDELPE